MTDIVSSRSNKDTLSNFSAVSNAPTAVLLVEDDVTEAKLILEALAGSGVLIFRVEWVTQLSIAIERLKKDDFEVVLLDISLPDGDGIEVFDRVLQAAPSALIMILSSESDEETARQAVQKGAYDYLLKNHVDAHL